MVDWKKLEDQWGEVPLELKAKISTLFRETSGEKLIDLFKREPDAVKVYERVVGPWRVGLTKEHIEELRERTLAGLRKDGVEIKPPINLEIQKTLEELETSLSKAPRMEAHLRAAEEMLRLSEKIIEAEIGPPPVELVEVEEKPLEPIIEVVPAEIPLIVRRPPTKEELEAERERKEARKMGIHLRKYKELRKAEALPTDEDKVMNQHLAHFSEEYISKDLPLPLEDVKRIINEHKIKSRYIEGTPVERIVEETGLTSEQVKVIVEKKGYYG